MYTCMNICVYVYLCQILLALLFTYHEMGIWLPFFRQSPFAQRVYTRRTHSHRNKHTQICMQPRPRMDCTAYDLSGLRTLHQSFMPRSVYWPWQVLCATVCGKQAYITHFFMHQMHDHIRNICSRTTSTWFRAGLSIIVACFGSDSFCFVVATFDASAWPANRRFLVT